MTFFEYLDAVYKTETMNMTSGGFNLKSHATTQVAQQLINIQRAYFRKTAYVTVVAKYFWLKVTGKTLTPPTLVSKDETNVKKAAVELVPNTQA